MHYICILYFVYYICTYTLTKKSRRDFTTRLLQITNSNKFIMLNWKPQSTTFFKKVTYNFFIMYYMDCIYYILYIICILCIIHDGLMHFLYHVYTLKLPSKTFFKKSYIYFFIMYYMDCIYYILYIILCIIYDGLMHILYH